MARRGGEVGAVDAAAFVAAVRAARDAVWVWPPWRRALWRAAAWSAGVAAPASDASARVAGFVGHPALGGLARRAVALVDAAQARVPSSGWAAAVWRTGRRLGRGHVGAW